MTTVRVFLQDGQDGCFRVGDYFSGGVYPSAASDLRYPVVPPMERKSIRDVQFYLQRK